MPRDTSQDLSGYDLGISIFLNFQNAIKVENHQSKLIIVISPFHGGLTTKYETQALPNMRSLLGRGECAAGKAFFTASKFLKRKGESTFFVWALLIQICCTSCDRDRNQPKG